MKTLRKFFDSEGRETTADKAVRCHELVLNDQGVVVKEANYSAHSAAVPRKPLDKFPGEE